jgi:glutathione peroxidase
MSIYDYSYTSIEGDPVSLSDYKGKVLLIVNTASKCGFTPQYEGLEKLYETYGDKGLVVLGFPCNQFKEQEPGTDEEVHEFCTLRFGVTFPLSAKINVRGEDADPIYKYLTENTTFDGMGSGLKNIAFETMLKAMYGKSFHDSSIKWNFTKFLLDREGKIVGRFEPPVEPKDLASAIEECL